MQETLPSPVVSQSPSHKKKWMLIIAIVVLLLAAGAAAWFYIMNEQAEENPVNTSQPNVPSTASQTYTKADLHVIYGGEMSTVKDVHIDFTSGKSTVAASDYTISNWGTRRLPDGTYRYAVAKDETANADGTLSLYIQHGKTTSKAYTPKSAFLNPGVFNSDGSLYYFYELNTDDDTAKIVSMTPDGTTATVADMPSKGVVTDNEALKQSLLLPKGVSSDGKVLYLEPHSCIECDGPGYGYVVGYTLATKKYEVLFADPHSTDANEYGSWTKLNDDYIAVLTAAGNNLGVETYAQASDQALKERLYLYNLHTKKYVRALESNANDAYIHLLNVSNDNKTLYYYTEKAIPYTPKKYSQDFDFATHSIYAYDFAAGKSTAVDFGLDAATLPLFVDHDKTKYVLGAIPRRPVEPDTNYMEGPFRVYSASLKTPANKKQLFTSEQALSVSLEWLGFEK